jgi:hypothetical protein
LVQWAFWLAYTKKLWNLPFPSRNHIFSIVLDWRPYKCINFTIILFYKVI